MSDMELALTTLAEATTAEIERAVDPSEFAEHRAVAVSGGEVAGVSQTAPDFGRLLKEVIQVEALEVGDEVAERAHA